MVIYLPTDDSFTCEKKIKWTPKLPRKASIQGDISAYNSMYVASLFHPTCSCYKPAKRIYPILWAAKGENPIRNQLNINYFFESITLIKKVAWPEITFQQRMQIAIEAVLSLSFKDKNFEKWVQIKDKTYEATFPYYSEFHVKSSFVESKLPMFWIIKASLGNDSIPGADFYNSHALNAAIKKVKKLNKDFDIHKTIAKVLNNG